MRGELFLSEASVNPPVRLLGGGGVTPEKGMFPLPPRTQAQPSGSPNPSPQPLEPGDSTPVFLADASEGADLLNLDQSLAPIARLCLTARVETPLLIGLVGPAGAGKSFALNRLRHAIQGAASAGQAGLLSRLLIVPVRRRRTRIPPSPSPRPPSPRSTRPRTVRTTAASSTRPPMPAAIRRAPPKPPRTGTTISSSGSMRSARRATRSRRDARAWPTRCSTIRRARGSTRWFAPAARRSKPSCGASISPARTPRSATATSSATSPARAPDRASDSPCVRFGWRRASDACSASRSSPSSSLSRSISCGTALSRPGCAG